MIVMTGTGPIGLEWDDKLADKVRKQIRYTLLEIGPENISRCLSGLSLGYDLILAEECMLVGIPIVGYLPCSNYHKNWSHNHTNHCNRVIEDIQKLGGSVYYVSNHSYTSGCNKQRYERMFEDANLLLAYYEYSNVVDKMRSIASNKCWRQLKSNDSANPTGTLFTDDPAVPDKAATYVLDLNSFKNKQDMQREVRSAMHIVKPR